MVYVDRRTGSAELYTPLQQRSVPVELTTLDYGDLALVGNGPDGACLIGIERKRIRDLLQSLTSGRLAGHQLPGLVQHYPYRWLLVEGSYRESRDGYIEVPRGAGKPWEEIRFRYRALEAYLLSLTMRGGLLIQRTYSIEESVAWLDTLWQWWTKKDWQDHRSHITIHQTPDVGLWIKPTLAQRVAAQLPGIDERAALVARTFPTVLALAVASEDQWKTIPGIGKKTASRIVAAIQDGKD